MNYFNLSEKIIDDETWKIILEREKIAKYKNYVTHN